MKRFRTLAVWTLLATLLGLVSCSSVRETLNVETTAEIEFVTAEDINPDTDGRASPLVIRLFKLADSRQFQLETFLTLYEDAGNRLGKDLLDTIILKEFIPGETRIEQLKLTPDVRFIGLMAEYVQYDNANSMLLLPIESHSKNRIRVHIEKLELLTAEQKKARERR